MSIRQRFLLTFISLVFFGVMAISSIAILFVRDHLLRTSRDSLDQQAQYLATILVQSDTSDYQKVMTGFIRYSSYRVELLDAEFMPVRGAGEAADSNTATFSGIAPLAGPPSDERQYVRITASESEIRSTLRRVRYIIYAGIFITLLLTAGASWILADRLARPIRDLAGAARRITHGEQKVLPLLEREDEIGELASDVAAMAQRLQDDISDLQRLNLAQEDFIAALSHEVRNPIFSARGYLEMALEDSGLTGSGELDRQAILDLLRKTERNLLRIHTLFADMLMLVRLEFGQEPVELGTVSLAPVVAELQETFMPLARERSLSLVLADGDLSVVGQQELIKVTLSNLLSNALRHTEKGEVRLTVEAVGKSVQLTVSDTGMGIPEEHLQRIFEKFYRIDKARSRNAGGTGLGLAIVKQCMQSLGSKIEVTSEMGRGSQFTFRLPKA